jgi:hypothetical protein
MSAFLVTDNHICQIINFMVVKSRRHHFRMPSDIPLIVDGRVIYRDGEPTDFWKGIGDILYVQNAISVDHRYPGEDCPRVWTWKRSLDVVDAVQFLKLLDCMEYQSCETDDYYMTPAYHVLNALRRYGIQRLTGYDNAAWCAAA